MSQANTEVAHASYDDFAGPELDAERWAYLEYPMPDGVPLRCAEAGAATKVSSGEVEVRVDRFENSHGTVQIIDNPKHFLLSTRTFPVPDAGAARFSVEMAATNIDGNPDDFRDGVASFNVLDLASGMVFDLVASSNHIWSIYERLALPGVDKPFTYMIEAPFAGIGTKPGQFHRYQIELDRRAGRVRWHVDDLLAFDTTDLPVMPRRVTLGFGLFTLHPLSGGASRSVRGQGMTATWRNLNIAGTVS
jgi:hypothetical protein